MGTQHRRAPVGPVLSGPGRREPAAVRSGAAYGRAAPTGAPWRAAVGAGAALDGVATVCPPDVGGRVPAGAGVGVPPLPFAATVGVTVPGVAVRGVAVPGVAV